MTDLNNVLSNLPGVADLFSNNESCETAINGEILAASEGIYQKDTQNPLPTIDFNNPNAFILLLTHVVEKISNYQENPSTPDKLQLSPSETIHSESEEVSEDKGEEQAISEMESNVAVSWINSLYYRQEIEINQSDAEQKDNPIDLLHSASLTEQEDEKSLPRLVQVTQNQTVPNEMGSKNNVLSEEIKQQEIHERDFQEQQPVLVEVKDNLQNDADQILHSNFDQYIKNTLFQSEEPVEHGVDSPSIPLPHLKNMQLMASNLPLESQFNSLENPVELNKVDEFFSFQPLTEGKEEALPLPISTATGEHSVGTELQPIVPTLKNEVPVDVPREIENRGAILEGAPQSLTIPIEVDKPEWAKQFSEHIIWLGQQEIKSAVIKIHPEDLGPLEINIKVVNDSATVNIITHNDQIRDIVDQSLPRLQAMMAEQGLNLSEVQVDSEANPRQFSQNNNRDQEQLTQPFEEEVGITPLRSKERIRGLVDYFA
ncbi:flagellar hook-length control protein FliK [Legionella sp. PATHC035]|uniref:flagellar hook-length control protein FliK n=1 Tax=Legionella sp. PATHC035 TaxID=2992040 RepID=UPI002244A1B6|nr:flagellar hook-length control protein FliK [Legionella sp. PATHC035]MCW8407542.1 flagellar hook-length control protein FliK [Legionella sp. PATHC035]